MRDELLAAGIGRPDQYEVIAPGVEMTAPLDRDAARAHLDLPADVAIVAFVARLAGVKRPDRFVEVATRVAAERPDVHFVVAGDGARFDDLRAAADVAPLAGE